MRYRRNDLVLLEGDRMGEIRYVGHVKGAKTKRQMYGIFLTKGEGEHDGEFKGKRYFKCAKGKGIFVLERQINGKYKPPEKEAAARPERKPRGSPSKKRDSDRKGSMDSLPSVGGPRQSRVSARTRKPLILPNEYQIGKLDKVLVGIVNLFPQNKLGDPNVAPINQKPILPEMTALFSTAVGCQILVCKDPLSHKDFLENFFSEVQKSDPDLVCLFVFGRATLLQVDTLTGRVANESAPLFTVPDERKVEQEDTVPNNLDAIKRPTPVLTVGSKADLSMPEIVSRLSGGSSKPRLLCACIELGDQSKHGRPLDVAEDWATKYRPPLHSVSAIHFYETHHLTLLRDRFIRRMLQTFNNRAGLSVEQILAATKTIVDRNTVRERAIIPSLLPKALYFASIDERSEIGGINFLLDKQDVPPYTLSDVKFTFNENDSDKDGKLNRKEFESALEDIHLLFNRDSAKKIYDEITAGAISQKKGIDYQEFRARLPGSHNDFDPMWHRLLHHDDHDEDFRDVQTNLEKKIGGLSELLKYIENKQGSWKMRGQAMELTLDKLRQLEGQKFDKALKQFVASLTIQLNPKIRFEIVRAACLTLAELAQLYKDKMARLKVVSSLCTALFGLLKCRDPLIINAAYNCMRCLLTFLSDDKHGAVFGIIGNACADKAPTARKLALELLGVYLENSLDMSKTKGLKDILLKGLKDRDPLVQKASMVNIAKLGYLEALVAEEIIKTCTPAQKAMHGKLKSALSMAQAALTSPKGMTMETLARLKVAKPTQRPRALSSLEQAHDVVRDAFDTYANANDKLKYVCDVNTGLDALAMAMKPAKPNKEEYKKLFLKYALADKSLDYDAFEIIFESMDKTKFGELESEEYEIKAPSQEELMNRRYNRRGALTPTELRAPPITDDRSSLASEDLSQQLPTLPLSAGKAPARVKRGGRNRRRGGVVNLQKGQLESLEQVIPLASDKDKPPEKPPRKVSDYLL